ncbi:hypothetical protein LCGC14_2896560, partial [marine sediment metagenome]
LTAIKKKISLTEDEIKIIQRQIATTEKQLEAEDPKKRIKNLTLLLNKITKNNKQLVDSEIKTKDAITNIQLLITKLKTKEADKQADLKFAALNRGRISEEEFAQFLINNDKITIEKRKQLEEDFAEFKKGKQKELKDLAIAAAFEIANAVAAAVSTVQRRQIDKELSENLEKNQIILEQELDAADAKFKAVQAIRNEFDAEIDALDMEQAEIRKANLETEIEEAKLAKDDELAAEKQRELDRIILNEKRAARQKEIDADYVISTIPLTLLVKMLKPKPPADILDSADKLDYRSLVVLGMATEKQNILGCSYMYLLDRPFNRISEMNEFSPQTSPPGENIIVVEIPCLRDSAAWTASKEELFDMCIGSLAEDGFLGPGDVKRLFLAKA